MKYSSRVLHLNLHLTAEPFDSPSRKMLKKVRKKDFSAQDFVDQLLREGAQETCDETNESFVRSDRLPPFYDERLFRKGQEFFHKHAFSMYSACLYGLVAILSIPTILRILIFTKQSSSAVTAYKRYVATIFHMTIWYDEDFKPGSKLWKSISQVRHVHNSASKRGSKAGVHRIFQKDMALTQFGFMGFQLSRSHLVGIHDASEEEWKSFLHVWRVVGYLLGINDRFNLCSGSVQETKEICELLISQAFKPEILKRDKDFLSMARHVCSGLWPVSPILNFKTSLCFLHALVQETNGFKEIPEPTFFKLSWGLKLSYYFQMYVFLYWMKNHYYRLYRNFIQKFTLWFFKVLPLLAFYKFGIAHSYVDIKV
nr:uncharacterized protein LOC111517615 [Leptinotarsa decemlineata]